MPNTAEADPRAAEFAKAFDEMKQKQQPIIVREYIVSSADLLAAKTRISRLVKFHGGADVG